jgi:hypothetical protein
MRGATKVSVGLSVILALVVGIGLVYAVRTFGQEDPRPDFFSAETDAEWLAIIADAKARADSWDGFWPDLASITPATVVASCSELPDGVLPSQSAIELSPDGSQQRVIAIFFLPEENAQYAVAVYRDSDPTGCPELVEQVSEVSPYYADVDRHVCEQMGIMASGSEPEDRTLRPASPKVAEAYIEAFCTN